MKVPLIQVRTCTQFLNPRWLRTAGRVRLMDVNGTTWPPLEEAYTDEFGLIQHEVYRAAGELWPQAERLARAQLGDEAAGLQLMLKAAAIISRKRVEQPDLIHDLKNYLFQTFKRLVLAELKKETGHRQRELEHATDITPDDPTEKIEREILIQQICQRMDKWTRTVFELLNLGYDYNDIARMLGMRAKSIRNRYNKQYKKIKQQLDA